MRASWTFAAVLPLIMMSLPPAFADLGVGGPGIPVPSELRVLLHSRVERVRIHCDTGLAVGGQPVGGDVLVSLSGRDEAPLLVQAGSA
ncbi:MAG: hypothetical protein GF320_20005, partial [Armatimonadia bacterium]|nr:hypothetical protein [Armatimonadia bacterium]